MSDWSPKSLWDRMRRTVEGWMDPDAEVDEADGFFFDRSQAQGALIGQLAQLIGERPAHGIEMLLQAASDQMAAKKSAALGFVMLLVGASSVFAELRTDLNRIWRCKAEKVNGAW